MINYFLVNLISKLFEPMTGVEPVTPSLPRKCSTTELHRLVKFIIQPISLSYSHNHFVFSKFTINCKHKSFSQNVLSHIGKKRAGDETRTRDPNLGRVMLYQLSYSRILCALMCVSVQLLFSLTN